MRSAISLLCFFDIVKSLGVAGQRPQQGTKFCRMGRNSIHPSVHQRGVRAYQRGLKAFQRGLRACQRGARACQEAQGGWTDLQMDRISPHSTELCPLPGLLPKKGQVYLWVLQWGGCKNLNLPDRLWTEEFTPNVK